MNDRATSRDLEHASAQKGPLHRVALDEPIGVWAGPCGPTDVDVALSACCSLPHHGRLTLVLWLPQTTPATDAARALAKAGAFADTLVLIASEGDRLRWGALGVADLCAIARGSGGVRVLVEPDSRRAVAGSMQRLRSGDTFCVVWSTERGRPALDGLLALGAAWRNAWDEPEDGEFHGSPRGPDGDRPCAS